MKWNLMRFYWGLLAFGLLAFPARSQVDPFPDSTRKYVRQWQDSRYGMFIHWGPVTLRGTEIGWSRGTQVPRAEYDTLYRQFNPTGFNAQEWVTLARNAGMKYMTFTTKHHDGFSMFNTQQSPYNIMNSPFARDVTLELANECVRQGVRFDTYYSVNDWYHPDWTPYDHGGPGYSLPGGQTPSMARYKDFLKRQLQEIIQNYNPGVLWFDGDWFPSWNSTVYPVEVFQYLKNMKPSLVIDNRLQNRATWQANYPNQAGDYDTPEQVVGAFNDTIPWETCITIAQQWAYSPTNVPKTTQELVTMFINVMGGDGNLLLNLGPGPDGRMVAGEASRLLELGAWVNPRASAVYGTRGGPFPPSSWGGATYKNNILYLHIVNWSGNTQSFPALSSNILSARLLVGTGTVQFAQNSTGFTVTLPTASRTAFATTIELTLDSAVNPRPPQRYRNVASGCNATQSSTAYGGVPSRACDGNTDGNYNNNSVTHTDSTAGAWWMVNLGANYPVSFVSIYNRTDGWMYRLGNYNVILLDQNQNPIWSNLQTSYPNPLTTIDAGGRTARYVRIQLTGTGYLALAEVQVMMDTLTTPILGNRSSIKRVGSRISGKLGPTPVFNRNGSDKDYDLSGEVVRQRPKKP